MVILVSNKIEYNLKIFTRVKERHYMLTFKSPIHQGDITVIKAQDQMTLWVNSTKH